MYSMEYNVWVLQTRPVCKAVCSKWNIPSGYQAFVYIKSLLCVMTVF